MLHEEHVSVDAFDVVVPEDRLVIRQRLVDVRHDETDYLRSHAMLYRQAVAVKVVLDHPFEERYVQMELLGELVDRRVGTELLMVTDHYQMLTSVRQCRHHVGLENL